MQTMHTPGEWKLVHNSWEISTIYGPGGDVVATCPIDSLVDEGSQDLYEARKEANALLIAAAPDYAKVASDAADLLEQYAAFIRDVKADDLVMHPYLPEVERVAEDLRAAIAKATGGAA